MIVYKYLNQEGALATVNNNCVTLKTSLEYNDPFDSVFFASRKERSEAYKLFINYELFKELYDQFVTKKKKAIRYRFYSKVLKQDIIQIAKEVNNKSVYRTYPEISMYYMFASKVLKRSDSSLRRDFNKMIDRVLDKIRGRALISCFGLENNSMLMWSHYGEKHKGACIEFEVDEKEFKKVRYSEKLPVFKLTEIVSIIFGNEFNGKEVDTSDEALLFALEPLLTKSISWSYEKEVRCIFSKDKPDMRIHRDEERRFLLEMPKIKRIYIGCNADKAFITKIKNMRDKSIPVVVFKRSDERYEIIEQQKHK